MNFFESEFFRTSRMYHDGYYRGLERVLFPSVKMTTDGDVWLKKVMKKIDQSKDYAWILTYAFDSSFTANLVLKKMIAAQKRGVNCVLYVDDLQQYVNKELRDQFEQVGGQFKSLNPTWRHVYKGNIPTQEFFRRHHEKLTVIDDFCVIGSSNYQDCYGGFKLGSYEFYDMNMMFENVNLEVFRSHFQQIADLYKLELKRGYPNNQELTDEYTKKYPDSKFKFTNYQFLKTHQPVTREIQAEVLKLIDNSQEKIVLIHPYYYPVKKFERAIQSALSRGVKVELLTSAKRDQPAYHQLKNGRLMSNLLKHGCDVYELHEKLLHMKAYQIDDKHYSIGSFNNDRWSWKLNNEANIQVNDDPIEVQRIQTIIDEVKSRSKFISDPEGRVGPIRLFKMKFWELFLYLSEVMMSKNKYIDFDKYKYKKIYNEWDDQSGTEY